MSAQGERYPDHRRGMPPWLPRAIVLFFAALGAFLLGRWAFGQLRGLFVITLVSLFLTFAIEPAVNWLARRGWRRGAATGLIFVVLFVLAAVFVLALGSVLVTEARSIGNDLPDYANQVVDWLNRTFHTDLSRQDIQHKLTRPGGTLASLTDRLARNAVGYGATLLGTVFQAFTIALFTFYLSADGPRIRNAACSLLPPARQRHVQRAWDIAVDKTGAYLYSRALLAVLSGVFHYVALRVIGVPFALALSVWVAVVSQFIPAIGTYIAAALPVLVALAHRPSDGLWVILFVIAYQQLENYVFLPKISARTLAVHPAVAFGSVLAGAALLGPAGALLALPAAATLQAFVGEYLRRYEVTETPEAREARNRDHDRNGHDDNPPH